MIEQVAMNVGTIQTDNFSIPEESFVDSFEKGVSGSIEKIETQYNMELEFQGSQQMDIGENAVGYMLDSKNSLLDKASSITDSLNVEDGKTVSFMDKLDVLNNTFSYHLEITFYNAFMSQTARQADGLLQMK